jgi:hypothetical protein
VRKPSSVQAWARLRVKDAEQTTGPADTESVTHDVLRRVKNRVGYEAESIHVLPNLGVFIVSANPEFIRELKRQPEIASVKPTNEPDLTLIHEVKSNEVSVKPETPPRPRRRRAPASRATPRSRKK